MIYKWKQGTRVKGNAQAVGEHLEALRVVNGGWLSASAVVVDAEREDAPTHSMFEWDQAKAAQEYRLQQARHIMASICVSIRSDETAMTTRALVSIRGEDGPYTSIISAMGDETLRKKLLTQALRELEAFRKKYEHLEELTKVFDAVKEVEGTEAA